MPAFPPEIANGRQLLSIDSSRPTLNVTLKHAASSSSLLTDSDWILVQSACCLYEFTVQKRIMDRLQTIYGQIPSTVLEPQYPTRVPVPIIYQDTSQSRDDVSPTRRLVQVCLGWANYLLGYALIDWRPESTPDNMTFIPQLFMREDIADEHKASIMQVMTVGAQSTQTRRELGMVKTYFEQCITSVLGVTSHWWKFVQCHEDVLKGNSTPFTVIVPIDGEDTLNEIGEMDEMEARSHFSHALHSTALRLIHWHYKSHGWSLDRTLSANDARVLLDERLYLFGIRYNARELIVYVNYPILRRSDRGGFRWAMLNEQFFAIRLSPDRPHSIYASVRLFMVLATIEQHMRVLAHLLS
ncbi:hypothetical protein CERSUDRAFT_117055 [Gelatoporia subvermispora B]|uniref:Uncharacterized protein n=1 Tax=Ceriporiopsis subvermispora (strain B) TaxID=914234 RepID=M2R836_CERS8|nr:hypothetical protein CERSUDRAFT_117055 [Gelatoporia subvermispora B]